MEAQPQAEYDHEDQVLRVSSSNFYLLIRISIEELFSLGDVRAVSWDERGSIRAGEALGNPVHWSRSSVDPTAVSVLVGADDETWELALELPADVLLSVMPAS